MHTTPADRLATVLFAKGKRVILSQLFGHPDRKFFVREIARGAGVSASTLSRDLSGLTEAGILERTKEGRQVYFRANPDCPIFEELKGLVTKTFGMAEVIRAMLLPFAGRIDLALVYGSVARGDHTSKSDVDLMIVGDLDVSRLSQPLLESERRLSRSIVPTVYSKREFREKLRARNHFLTSVLSKPVVSLIGDYDEFKRDIQGKAEKSR